MCDFLVMFHVFPHFANWTPHCLWEMTLPSPSPCAWSHLHLRGQELIRCSILLAPALVFRWVHEPRRRKEHFARNHGPEIFPTSLDAGKRHV